MPESLDTDMFSGDGRKPETLDESHADLLGTYNAQDQTTGPRTAQQLVCLRACAQLEYTLIHIIYTKIR